MQSQQLQTTQTHPPDHRTTLIFLINCPFFYTSKKTRRKTAHKLPLDKGLHQCVKKWAPPEKNGGKMSVNTRLARVYANV